MPPLHAAKVAAAAPRGRKKRKGEPFHPACLPFFGRAIDVRLMREVRLALDAALAEHATLAAQSERDVCVAKVGDLTLCLRHMVQRLRPRRGPPRAVRL